MSLVRAQRALILEPAIAQAEEYLASFPPDDPLEDSIARSTRAKMRLRNGKQDAANRRRQESGPSSGRPRGPGGVFIKRSAAESLAHERALSESAKDDDDKESGRGMRKRRPSSRFLDGASDHTTSRSPSLAPPPPGPRLTIRIPARIVQKSARSSGTSETAGRPSASPSSTVLSASHADEDAMEIKDDEENDMMSEDENEKESDDIQSSQNHSRSQSRAPPSTPRSCFRFHVYTPDAGEGCISSDAYKVSFANGFTGVPDVPVKAEPFVARKTVLPISEPPKPSVPERTDTYKQAWTVEEQHILERLLEEYPDGTRNRYY